MIYTSFLTRNLRPQRLSSEPQSCFCSIWLLIPANIAREGPIATQDASEPRLLLAKKGVGRPEHDFCASLDSKLTVSDVGAQT